MLSGAERILQERFEQFYKHNRSIEADLHFNSNGELVKVAQLLSKEFIELSDEELQEFSQEINWSFIVVNKMSKKPYKERIIIAGALLAAEYDRLNYLTNTEDGN